MDQPSLATCPRCGASLDEGSVDGLCAKCLGALNFTEDTALSGEAVARTLPPAPEEIAAHFPQLEIIEFLGRGGMGVVYKARQKTLGRLVALKLLAPERVGDPKFAERFAHEAKALAALNHPNIVTIHDFGQAGGFFYLLMEFVDGVNLRQALKAGRFTPAQALAVVPPVCEALQYAHDHGIVHRDIKPENLLLDRVGRVKIADFGIAKMMDADAPSVGLAESQPAGTPQYMAPEQKQQRATDHRADIYSLGVVLYEMLTGELPGAQLQPPSRKVQIDVRLDEIVLRALESRPELRYATAAEFRTQLEVLAESGSGPRAAAPGFLKVITSTFMTAEELATTRGQFFAYQTRGQLILDREQLTHTRAGHTTVILLSAIRDVSLGQYPRSMNPVGISLVSVTYEEADSSRQVLLSPMEGWFAFPSTWDALAAEWHAAIRAAVKAATGREPGSTPREQLRVPASNPWVLLAMMSGPLLFGVGLFSISIAQTGTPPRSLMPTAIITFVLALGFLLQGLFVPWVLHRRAATPPGALTPRKRAGLALLSVPLLALNGFIVWLCAKLSRVFVDFYANPSVQNRPEIHPPISTRLANGLANHQEIPWIVALIAVVIVDFFIIRAVWRAVNVPPPPRPAARRTRSTWLTFVLGFLCLPLLMQLLLALVRLLPLLTGGHPLPDGPTVLFGFPEAIILAVIGLLGLRIQHLREHPPAAPRGQRVWRALAAVGTILVGVLAFSGGMAAKPWLLRFLSNTTPFNVEVQSRALDGRVVLFDVFKPKPFTTQEVRMVLEGPDQPIELRSLPRGFVPPGGMVSYVWPSPSPARQPYSDFGSSEYITVAFILPTDELAKDVYHRFGPGRRRSFDIDPTKPGEMDCLLFGVRDADWRRYSGRLLFSAERIREGHPRWVEVRSLPSVDSLNTLELWWEVRTVPPAAVTLKHRWAGGGSETMDVLSVGDQPANNAKIYQQRISALLYKKSDTRVGLRLIQGTQPSTKEFDGDFAALAEEMRTAPLTGWCKTERDWDIELCRVAGGAVTLRVSDPPAPIRVEPSTGLAQFMPVTGPALPVNEFRVVTTIAKPRHVAVLTLEAESAAGKDTLSEQSYYFVALDKSAPVSTTASWTAETRADGLVSFDLKVDSERAKGHWIDSHGTCKWLNGFVWTAVRPGRSFWVGPGDWHLNDTNTLTIFEGVKRDDPMQKATVRLHVSLYRLPEGFRPAKVGRVIRTGTHWRTDLGMPADTAFAPVHLRLEGKAPVLNDMPHGFGGSK